MEKEKVTLSEKELAIEVMREVIDFYLDGHKDDEDAPRRLKHTLEVLARN